MEPPARPHRRLIWKYAAVVVTLVAAAVVSVGLTELYFSYQDSKRALTRVERDKASAAATSIEQLMQDLLLELDAVAQPTRRRERRDWPSGTEDFHRLLERDELDQPGELPGLDREGAGRASRRSRSTGSSSGADLSGSPAFLRARAKHRYLGRSTSSGGSRPHMTISVAERAPGRGVVVAEIDLSSVRRGDRPSAGRDGGLCVRRRLARRARHPPGHQPRPPAHELRVASAGASRAPRARERAPACGDVGRDQDGTKVLSAFQTIDPLGWRVFVEEPLSEAFAPLKSAIWRTALLLVAFLLLAIATSVLLARRLVRPIESIQAAAARIGSGALDQRIEVASNDELGALAEEFNRMAARLQESYAGLEQKVEERTRELATALSELDEKSRELEAASRHKSEFLANMSHELRTPLNAIIGFSQVLRERHLRRDQREAGGVPRRHPLLGHHLLALINDVLDLSKVEAGQVELEVAPFSLREALERGIVMVRERATRTASRSRSRLEPGVDVVEGDERRIRQVIFNLLSNAVKFTPAGGAVDVRAARVNGEVRVSVADTGPGNRPRGPRTDLRGVPADRGGSRAGRGNGPRPRAVEAARRAARRPDLGRQRARPGEPRSCSRCLRGSARHDGRARSSSSRTTRRT